MKWRRLTVFVSILLSTIYVSVYGGTISYMLFFVTAAIPVIAVCYSGYVYARFKIYQKIDTRALVKGQEVPYYFNLSNESKMAFTGVAVSFLEEIQEVKGVEDKKEYCLLPGEAVNKKTSLKARYRGEYDIGIDSVMIRDCFGLFELTYKCPSKIQAKVLPRIVRLKSLLFIAEEEDPKQERFGSSFLEEVPGGDARKYVAGDEPRRIHWKLTACMDELMVRQYLKRPQLERIVVLDLGRIEGEKLKQLRLEDMVIECAIAVVNYMMEHGIAVKVVYEERKYQELMVESEAEFETFYEVCSSVSFVTSGKAERLIERIRSSKVPTADYIIVTGNLTKDLCAECLAITEGGGNASVISVLEEESKTDMLVLKDVNICTIHPEDDLVAKLSRRGW